MAGMHDSTQVHDLPPASCFLAAVSALARLTYLHNSGQSSTPYSNYVWVWRAVLSIVQTAVQLYAQALFTVFFGTRESMFMLVMESYTVYSCMI